MTKKEKLEIASLIINVYRNLLPVSRQLRLIGERQCNGYADTDWGRKQEARDKAKEAKLINRAISLADEVGLIAFHQTDPRGCALYLIDDTMDYTTYSRGIAIS